MKEDPYHRDRYSIKFMVNLFNNTIDVFIIDNLAGYMYYRETLK